MARTHGNRRGDTSGDTNAAKVSDSPSSRRPRKTKPPASVPGCEHRWCPGVGWRWRARAKVAGKVKVGEYGTREQAMDDAADMRERRLAGEAIQFVTLEEACQAVLDTVKGSAGTWRSYHEHFLVLCEHFGADEPLHAVTPARITDFISIRRAARVRGKPPSEQRIRKHLGALGRVFRLAIKGNRYAGANPLDRVEKPRVGKRRHTGVYTTDDLHTLFAALRKRTAASAAWDAAIVAALLFTGLRREGLCHVTTAMIDDSGGFIRELEQKRSVGSLVPITKPLAHVLPVLVAGADDTGHLVPRGTARGPRTEDGRPRTETERRTGTIDRVFRTARPDLPEPLRSRFRPHTFRHTLRTILAEAEVPESVRDAITDHAPASVGRSYEHPSPASVRAWAHKALDPLLTIVAPEATQAAQAQ